MQPGAEPKRSLNTTLLLLALWIVFYGSFVLLTPALLDDADSVHAEVAREILLRHDWVTLYANGIRYLEKAPLLYWTMAASFKVFGVSTAAARVPLAFTILALAFTVEAFARRAFGNARAGLYAALILLSSFGMFIFTRIAIPDAMVCLWLTLALYAFWLTEQPVEQASTRLTPPLKTSSSRPEPKAESRDPRISLAAPENLRLLCYAFAACCALNVLTKGFIGVVFPIAIVLIYLLLTRGLRGTAARVRHLYRFSSLAVFLAIAAPWHGLIALANPAQGHPGDLTFSHGHFSVPLPTDGNVHGWLWFYFVNEHILRYLNLRVPRDYDTVPLWLFWGLLLVWLMPWGAYVFHAFAAAVPVRSAAWRSALRHRSLSGRQKTCLLLAIWAAFPMLFFSLSTRQEYYVLPGLPAMILLIAAWLANSSIWNNDAEVESPMRGAPVHCTVAAGHNPELVAVLNAGAAAERIATLLLILGSLAAAACVFLVLQGKTASADTDLAALLQQNRSDYALSMGHFLDLNAAAMGAFRTPLLIAAIALAGGTFANFIFRRRHRPHAGNLALAAGAFGFLLAAHLGLQTFAPVLSSQQLAAALAPQLEPDDLIIIHQEYEYASTLGFYLQRPDYTRQRGRVAASNPIHILEGRSSNLWYGSFFADAPQIFETPQTLAQKWSGTQRIFLWQDLANQPSGLPALPGSVYVIAKSGGKEIVSNQPNR